jgi:phosphate-selective porin OprO/OprP
MRLFFTLAALIGVVQISIAQDSKPGLTTFYKAGRGAGFVTNDSSFSVNFQFRMQNRAIYNTESEDDPSMESMEMRVRRLRFKFNGFVFDSRLTYYIQLSFARGDMDWRVTDLASVNNSPNIVRDAIIYYQLTPRLRLGFGQTKLPGNRQRVISSGDQQFPERSIVNAGFNIDRDFGFFGWYTGPNYNLKGAITSGEGRNTNISYGGLAYTGRLELLPLGRFSGNNDDMEGDLEREPTPKIALSGSYHYNDRAERQAGQTGNDIFEPRSLVSMEADFLLKYNGWSLYSEYMNRSTSNPITVNVDDTALTRAVVVGEGFLTQVGYLFRSNIEIAGRYAQTRPNEALYNNTAYPQYSDKINEQFELGFSRYFRGHRVKLQTSLMYLVPTDLLTNQRLPGRYAGTFQFEIGI